MTTRFAQIFASLLLCLTAGAARSQSTYNFQPPQTAVAHNIYDLHLLLVGICAVIFVVVFGLMFYVVARHRRSVGHQAKQFDRNTWVQVLMTAIPCLIIVGLAYPATKTVIAMKDTSQADITVKATGYQWKWRYDYLGEDIGFYSDLATPREQIENRARKGENYLLEVDHPLVVPVGKKVRILVTANDVIHSWWVPAFGVKQDAIPGFVRDSWFKVDTPGVYRGQCAELCGKEHGFMPIVVEAVPQEKYNAWVADQRAKNSAAVAAAASAAGKTYSLDELKTEGEKVYTSNCVACHQANGQGMPPTFPALAHGKIATGPVEGVVDIVTNGSKKNPTMAAWKGQLSDAQIAAVITFARNSFGNTLGDMVQPSEIAAARK
jgi:cytochrome c oxidase subunit 2